MFGAVLRHVGFEAGSVVAGRRAKIWWFQDERRGIADGIVVKPVWSIVLWPIL
jgi:hypothetical protein